MGRRTALGLVLVAFLTVAGTAAADERDDKQRLDSKIGRLQDEVQEAREREGVLTEEISAVTGRIRALEDDVGRASSRLGSLEAELALHQRKLDRLNALFGLQTRRLVFLQKQYREAIGRLNERLIEIYTSDEPTPLGVVLESASFTDLLDQLDYLSQIGRQDERIAIEVERAKDDVAKTRFRTRRTRAQVAEIAAEVARRTNEQRQVRDRLVASQNELAAARADKRQTLAQVEEHKDELLEEIEALEKVSAELAAKIQAAQGSSVVTSRAPSASGFMWPVNGPVTSVFGWRWGRMHEGIDIAVPNGTPVVASAAGVVIFAGWLGGYGNLVVVDHGGGVATAYAHNTGFAVGQGQSVAQGQLIAYSGNTGNSTGPHVHYEVRVNGGAVDPLAYL